MKRLEYRGYDSAGIVTVDRNTFARHRSAGKLGNLEGSLAHAPLAGDTGLGHTRWATHGAATCRNAHPHIAGRVAVVHNGIVENHAEIRRDLVAGGNVMQSDTDTEVIAHLLDAQLNVGKSPTGAMRTTIQRIRGTYAFAAVFADYPGLMAVARRASPLAIGYGDGEILVGSDALALASFTRQISYLEDGDWAILRPDMVEIHDAAGNAVTRPVIPDRSVRGAHRQGQLPALHGKGDPRTARGDQPIHCTVTSIPAPKHCACRTCRSIRSLFRSSPSLPPEPAILPAWSASTGFESLARLPVEVEIASEFRYRDIVLPSGGATLLISQSGESLDTLMALRHARDHGQHVLGLVNVPESSIERESAVTLRTMAGPEICVASTKAFTTQLVALLCLALDWGQARGVLAPARIREIIEALVGLPNCMAEILADHQGLKACAHDLSHARDILFLGRGVHYPIALEGALKLKELSYIHAEGYAAGELKHGPIALVEDGIPVVIVAPVDGLFEKAAANVAEVKARGARIMLLSDEEGIDRLDDLAHWTFRLPTVDPAVAPLLYTLPVQLLAYYTAVEKGTDVDQPRNLAKSVTVE